MPPARLDQAGEDRFWLGVLAAERFFMGEAEVQKALNEFGYRSVTVDVDARQIPGAVGRRPAPA